MRAIWNGLLDLLYPRICAGCAGPVGPEALHLCWDCLASLDYVRDPFCSRCGDPAAGMVEFTFECPFCRRSDPGFTLARSAVRFRGAIRPALHAFKYKALTALSEDFASLLAGCVTTHFSDTRFDAVLPVPLHPRRERERSYNQSALLAAAVARRLRTACLRDGVQRVRDTDTQTHLSAAERRENVARAFVVTARDWLRGRRLLLVDDVMTTGATLAECARALRRAGAASVHAVTVARG